jgi:hypothetical protein
MSSRNVSVRPLPRCLLPLHSTCVIPRAAEWQAESDPIGHVDELGASLQYRLGVTDALCRRWIPALLALPRTTATGARRRPNRREQMHCSNMVSGGEGVRLACSTPGDHTDMHAIP